MKKYIVKNSEKVIESSSYLLFYHKRQKIPGYAYRLGSHF